MTDDYPQPLIPLEDLCDWKLVEERELVLSLDKPKKADKLYLDEVEQELLKRGEMGYTRSSVEMAKDARHEFIPLARYGKIARILREEDEA